MEEQSKKLSKVETELYANKYVKQQEAARARAKKNAQQRKQSGIKLISVNVEESAIVRFKNLLRRTNANKTALFMHMLTLCENALDEQDRQQQLQQQAQQQLQQQAQQHTQRQPQQQQNQQPQQSSQQQQFQNRNQQYNPTVTRNTERK